MKRINKNRRKCLRFILFVLILCSAVDSVTPQTGGRSFALLIGGLGGEDHYSVKFFKYLTDSRKAFIDDCHFLPENVIVLAEPRYQDEASVDGVSNAENIKAKFTDFSRKLTEHDDLYIILFGHGSFDGKNAKLNIPRRDLTDDDFAEWIHSINANRVIFINSASSSFPFIDTLSGPGRIIITATNKPTQRNITVFPEYFVEGLTDPAADFDKNGDLSVLEIFTYAAEKTGRFYSDNDHLATEFAMLEDTGDKRAFRVTELQKNQEGGLAEFTYFKRQISILASTKSVGKDSILIKLLRDKEMVEREIAKLKGQKDQYDEEDYYGKLEGLMVQLAKVNDRLDKYKDDH